MTMTVFISLQYISEIHSEQSRYARQSFETGLPVHRDIDTVGDESWYITLKEGGVELLHRLGLESRFLRRALLSKDDCALSKNAFGVCLSKAPAKL